MSADAIAVHLAAIVIKATAILLAGAVLAGIGGRAPARVRHALWTAVLAASLALPLLHLSLPARTPAWLRAGAVPAWPRPASTLEAVPPSLAFSGDGATRISGAAPNAIPIANPDDGRAPLPWSAIALTVWGCGTMIAAGRVLAGVARRRRIGRAGGAGDDGEMRERLSTIAARLGVRTPRLRMVPGAVPATWGLLRPVVVLPVSARDWPAERVDAVLHHELAHVRRRDALWCGIAECAAAVYWFHPGVWMARRAALGAQEQAADNLVLRTGGERFSYARALVETARLYAHSTRDTAPAFFRGRSELASRLRTLVHPAAAPHAAAWPFAALPAALAAAVTIIAPLRPAAASTSADVSTEPMARPSISRAAVPVVAEMERPRASAALMHQSAAAAQSPSPAPAALIAIADSPPADPPVTVQPVRDDRGSYAGQLAAAGLRSLTAGQVERMKNLDITPFDLREMRGAGLRITQASEAESLWVQGVTPAFVRDVRRAGMPIRTAADAVELWIHKVPATYVADMAAAGIDVSRATPVRVLHNHGVQPAYLREMASAGMPLRRPADILELHNHHVPAAFVAALRDTGLRGLTVREARRLHNFEVDPRDPAQIRTVSGYDRALARVPSLLPG